MSTTVAYEFVFINIYDEAIFSACPYARDSLRTAVKAAIATEQTFLSRFTKVNAISQQLTDGGQLFKVKLERA